MEKELINYRSKGIGKIGSTAFICWWSKLLGKRMVVTIRGHRYYIWTSRKNLLFSRGLTA